MCRNKGIGTVPGGVPVTHFQFRTNPDLVVELSDLNVTSNWLLLIVWLIGVVPLYFFPSMVTKS